MGHGWQAEPRSTGWEAHQTAFEPSSCGMRKTILLAKFLAGEDQQDRRANSSKCGWVLGLMNVRQHRS